MKKENIIKLLKILLFILVIWIIGYLCGCIFNKRNTEIIPHITDTISFTKYDTITQTDIKYVDIINVDTVEVVKKETDTVYLPIIQKHYNDSLWNIWISGVEPLNLDSVNFIIPEKTITINNVKKVIDKSPHIYGGIGLNRFCGDFASMLIVSSQFNNRWLIGANIGVMNNKITYGLNVQIKIF